MITEDSLTMTKDDVKITASKVWLDDNDMYFTVGENTYIMLSPNSYGVTRTHIYSKDFRSYHAEIARTDV